MERPISKKTWNLATSLLRDLNPDADEQTISNYAKLGFSCFLSAGEYITALYEQLL